ncbi:hypothetical protein Ae201684P_019256 [Aphanomyces euteiches]|nr:hypothetical protein Ae201684P_019256 [Aphanomyces euteiches]
MVKPKDPAKLSADASADNQRSTLVGMQLDLLKQAKQAAVASRSRFGQTSTASGQHEPVAAPTHATTTNPGAQSRSGRSNPAESHEYGSDDDDIDASAFPMDSADAQSKLIAELARQNQYLTEQLRSGQFPMQAHEEDDDDLDEWNLDAAPVGLSSNNGPRLHVLALEPLQRFGGSADGTDAAASYLRRFEENAAASGWMDDEAKRKFRLTVGRTVQDWYNQLRADEQSTWKALRASFVREYIFSPAPKQAVYYTMRQKAFVKLFEVVRGWKRKQQERAVTASVEETIKNEDRTENRRDLVAANHVAFLKVPPVTKNTSNLASKPFVFYSAVDCATLSDEYGLKEGKHFGHWQNTTFIENDMTRQAFLNAQIMDQAVVVLEDTGANMSIIHPSIVKRLGLKVDTTKTTDISGLGGAAVVNTQGIVDIKLTIGRGLAYVFPIAVCDFGNTGFDAILGMDFLFRAGVMVDASRRELNLPKGVYVELHDQPVRYSRGYMNYLHLNRDVNIPPGGSVVVPLPKLREGMPETLEYWVHRAARWITTALNSENKPTAYKVTNVSERNVFLSAHTVVGAISVQGERPLNRPMAKLPRRLPSKAE